MKKVLLVVVSICLCLAVFGTAALGGTAAAEKTEEELLQAAEDASKAKDYAKMLEYYEQAAEQGSSEALRQIGVSYVSGEGVEQN